MPLLLAAFQRLSANDVYTMAQKASVIRGFDYYRQQRLQGYAWSPDLSTLTAWVRGSRLYGVTFSLNDGFLTGQCDCPAWAAGWQCKHVLCVCFTTMNLLSPEVFRLPGSQNLRLASLERELLAGTSGADRRHVAAGTRPGREIVIDARHSLPQLFIRQSGVQETWPPRSPLPPELAPLLNDMRFTSGLGEDPLLSYLRRHDNAYPIVLQTAEGAIPLRWDPSVKCRSKTELHVGGDLVRIRAVCLADGVELERMVRFRTFVADRNDGRLLLLKDEHGWAPYLSLRQRLDRSDLFLDPYDSLEEAPGAVTLSATSGYGWWQGVGRDVEFTVSLREFESMQIDLVRKQAERTLRDLILKVDGQELPVLRREQSQEGAGLHYRLVLIPPPTSADSRAALYTLRAECRWGDRSLPPSASVFEWFYRLEQGRMVSGALRAQKRKAVLYHTFFKLRSVEDRRERDESIRQALHGPEFLSRAVTHDAQRLLKGSLSVYARPDVRLLVRGGRWEVWPIDKAREALLYQIPFELLGLQIFRSMRRYDEMSIEARALYQRLPELLQRLNDAGIELLYEDKALRSSRWDCSLTVDRKAGIDWFEIRPEIRCDGRVLKEAVWQEGVRRGGLVQTENGFRVLDAPTLERLRLLAGLSEQARPGRGPAQRLVRVPRLQIFDWLALRDLGVRVSLPAEDENVIARLLGFEGITNPPLPAGLRATLRPYQQGGYGWLAFLYQHRFGACLADDMGLGKTLQAICLLAAIKEGLIRPPEGVGGPHLVVAPTSLLFNWEQELARFSPGLKVRVYTGKERTLDADDGDVVLTTYGLVRRDIETLARTAFHVIVFDEAQAVKNVLADTAGAARRLKGFFKMAMTGTPLENHLGEYFSIIELCLPGLLEGYERFKADVKRAQAPMLERLLRRTRPFVLRRTKEQTLPDLPPKIESEVFLELTDRQKALYQQTVAQVRSTIDDAYRSRPSAQAQLIALTAILKLRQVCLSPSLLTGRPDEPSPKLDFLIERLQVLLEENHSALVFSQFTSFLDLVQEACARHDIPYRRLDGSTALGARKTRVTQFQTSEGPGVFLLSLKAGGQGLNLTKATYVFHLDPWWNPAVETQASDRAHRIGQKRVVSIVRILTRHTIEEKMLALKQRKLELYEAVMGAAVRGAGREVLTKADFDFLLSPGSIPS